MCCAFCPDLHWHMLLPGAWLLDERRCTYAGSRSHRHNARRVTMALQLNHVHLKTHDPEKTAQFYVETLGAKIVGKAGNNGYRLDLHGLSLNVTTFLESQSREQKYGMEHIAIDTDELDNLVEKLKGQNINILEQTTIWRAATFWAATQASVCWGF